MRVLKKKSGQSMAEFALILPVTALLLCGVVQFSIICINALLVKYSAYAVARSAVSYVEPWKSDLTAQQANYTVKQMLTGLNDISEKTDNVVAISVPESVYDAELVFDDVYFKNSEYKYRKITLKYDLPLYIPFANRFFSALYSGKKNGKYYFPIYASAVMQTGVKK